MTINTVGALLLSTILLSLGLIHAGSINAAIRSLFGFDRMMSVSEQIWLIVLILAITDYVVSLL